MRLIVRQLGRTDYEEALGLQSELRLRVLEDSSTEYLVLVEHPPVITLGRRAKREHVLAGERELRRLGFTVHETSRGGDVTYHGPGQLVGYPIIDLNLHRLGIRTYMRSLEEALIRALRRFDISAERIEGYTGVWAGGHKIAAIGVAIRRWITYHGFALNVNTDLSHFQRIVPCGITDRPVISMAKLLGGRVGEWEVRKAVEDAFREVFGFAANATPAARRFPPWLRKRLRPHDAVDDVRGMLSELDLHTVCQSARCPNLRECFAAHTATFMILGDVCTRRCRFCAVSKGEPPRPDPHEPPRVAEAVDRLGLKHVVITSVTRDDLPDGGAGQFAATIRAVRERTPATVEVLIPDFRGSEESLRIVLRERPDVLNHNLETVPSLYETVRPGASCERSLELLGRVKSLGGARFTKSGLMLGLGETIDEVLDLLWRLRHADCDLLTLGQYLAPSADHLPVVRFVHPDEFDELAQKAREMGFRGVASGPFVRSSHNAAALFEEAKSVREVHRKGKTAGTLRSETSF